MKFGGIRVTFTKVGPEETCPGCGRTQAECSLWWDEKLGVTGHAGDTGRKSEYFRNLARARRAIVEGLDPYCFRAGLKGMGYEAHWTPNLPSGSLVLTPYTQANTTQNTGRNTDAKRKSSNGIGPKRGGGRNTGGSGRRGKRKSVRRKR